MIRPGLIASMFLSSLALAQSPPQPVWQIGKPDNDYRDLGNAGNVFGGYPQAFPKDVLFEVGRSDAAKDFSAAHPGPVDQWAGGKTHPFRIAFDLKGPAAPGYELTIDIVDTQSQFAPVLRVQVNNQHADLTLDKGVGDIAVIHPEKGKHRSLTFTVPGDLLRPTGNVVELTVTGGSWILYDAVSFRALSGSEEIKPKIGVSPTVFLVEKNGQLEQECTVSVQRMLSSEPVLLEVKAADESLIRMQVGKPQLGALTARVTVPATQAARELTFMFRSGGQSSEIKVEQTPVKKWHIFVAPSTHTDIGYTDVQDRVIELHNRNTDLAIELAREFPLYHWNLESSWAAQMWLRDNPYTRKKLLDASRSRRIGIEAGYLNMLTGLCSHEELIRNMYYTARLARLHGVPFESLTLTDAPSHVWTVPSVLAGAGIKYLSCGVNQTRAPLFKKGINQKAPFWWEGPDGGRVLTWLSDGYSQAELIGLKWGVNHMREVVERYMIGWNKRSEYPYDAILLHGAYSDNVAIGRDIAETITDYAKRYAYPKVMLAGNKDFFEHIEKNFADRIPTVRGCGGSWWEDGAASSALETAVNRRNHKRIATAEAAWAVLAAIDRKTEVPRERINRVWDNILLYDEHTWGAWNSITAPASDFVSRQWAIKADYARMAEIGSRNLLRDALHALAGRVGVPGGSVLVFNPSGQARSGAAEVSLPKGSMIVDGDKPVPQQVVREEALSHVTVAFQAADVPALGYRTYTVRAGAAGLPRAQARIEGATIENDYYRVTLDEKTGGVRSIIDKRRAGRELVDASSPYKLGQLVYAAGGDEKGATQVMCPNPAGVKFHLSGDARIERGRAGESDGVFSSIRSIAKAAMFPQIVTEVILFDADPRIDLSITLQKDMTLAKEAVYIAFPVAGANPKFRYEIGGGTVRPNEDHWPGGCRDWLSIQRWLTVQTDAGTVVWSSPDTPLVQLCAPQSGKWLDELPITNGTILAYAMNNYWFTNYKAGQDGRFTFRYSLTSGDSIDAAAATQFGLSVQHPLVATVVAAGKDTPLPAVNSYCSVAPPNVELSCVKPAEDGKGIIIRVHETGGQACDARISVKLPEVSSALLCDLVERNHGPAVLAAGELVVPLKAYGTQTIRLCRSDEVPPGTASGRRPRAK